MTAATAAISTAARPAATPATDPDRTRREPMLPPVSFFPHGSTDMISELASLSTYRGATLAALLLLSPTATWAAPLVPTDDSQVIERLPTPAGGTKRELRDLRDALAKNPDDLGLAVRLARRYVEIGRTEADPRYYGHAEALLQPWWRLGAPPADVLLLRATLRQNRHEFSAAL